MTTKRLLQISLLLLPVLIAGSARADSWPSRPVTLVVPFAAGGVSDVTTRMLAAKLRAEFEQSFIVENRTGAGGNVGAAYVANASPDGYTFLQGTSAHVTNMSLYKKLPYNFTRDLTPVAPISRVPVVVVVHPSLPVTTLADFMRYAKSPGNSVNYGSGGSGSVTHLAPAVFAKMSNTPMTHVPYKGNAPALVDLLGGRIQVVFSPMIDAISHVRAGRLKALSITTNSRSPLLPEVQTVAESVPGYEVAMWNGIFSPAGTPPEIVDKLGAAIARILRQPDTVKFLADQGSEPLISGPGEFKRFVDSEMPKWRTLVETAGARVE